LALRKLEATLPDVLKRSGQCTLSLFAQSNQNHLVVYLRPWLKPWICTRT